MNTLKSTALTAACITILASGAATSAPPQYQCYDFNDLASDASYTVGDVIAGGASPELALYLVSVEVVPKQPVSRVRTRLAQNISQTGAFANANIKVNGEKHESPAGFAGMNGKSIGRPAKGKATITASVAPSGGGNWHNGTLELDATQGGIESFLLGGHQWRIDDMCFGL